MKKYLLIITLAVSFLTKSYCQLADTTQTKQTINKVSLLEKSKQQSTAGYILLGGGIIIGGIGFVRATTELGGILDPDDSYHDDNISEILGFGGLAMVAGSVPLLIASKKK